VRIQQRPRGRARTLGHALLAFGRLVQVERRCVEHAQHLRASAHGCRRGLVEPGVFADQHAEAQAIDVEYQRALPCIPPRAEVAALVEDLVVRQLALGITCPHEACGQDGRGIEAARHGHRLGPDVARAVRSHRMTHHHVQALEIRQIGRQRLQRQFAGRHECRSKQEILWWVSCQREFGREHDACTGRMRGAGSVGNQPRVARQVADRRVDLRQRDLHDARS
jgi:hypothetical protein